MRHRNQEKEQIVRIKTIEILSNNGFESFSANQLAKACKISIATLYIYYKDKNDLIIKIALEEVKKMREAAIKDFDPEIDFEEGLHLQWKNRYQYLMANPTLISFFELLRSSSYHKLIYNQLDDEYDHLTHRFMQNAIARGEINKMPTEIYWSIAFAPLHALIRAHYESQRSATEATLLAETMVWQTFELVMKALKR
ncbi:TetR/AcrR family transcriptional regulator [Mucilaginibacter sp.]